MWILLGILLFLVALITVILLLPVYVIIKNDENQNLILRYKFLWRVFGEDPDPNDPIVKALKKSAGITRFEQQNLKKSVEKSGLSHTVKETVQILLDLLHQLIEVLQYCTAKRFDLTIVCTSDDPADGVLKYGRYCAIVYPLIGWLSSALHLPRKARNIDIRCDLVDGQEIFRYDILLRVKVFYVLKAFFRVAFAEAGRIYQEEHPTDPSAK